MNESNLTWPGWPNIYQSLRFFEFVNVGANDVEVG